MIIRCFQFYANKTSTEFLIEKNYIQQFKINQVVKICLWKFQMISIVLNRFLLAKDSSTWVTSLDNYLIINNNYLRFYKSKIYLISLLI